MKHTILVIEDEAPQLRMPISFIGPTASGIWLAPEEMCSSLAINVYVADMDGRICCMSKKKGKRPRC